MLIPCCLNSNQSEHHAPANHLPWMPHPPPTHFAFKNVFLKSFRVFGISEGTSHPSPFTAVQEVFLCSKLQCLDLFGLIVHWAHELAFGNKPGFVHMMKWNISNPLDHFQNQKNR